MEDQRSRRIESLEQSDIRRMSTECERVGGVNLGQGICDLPTPEPIIEGTHQALEEDLSTYSSYWGAEPLRRAIAANTEADNGLQVDPSGEVVVTVGSTGAYACAVEGLLDPGEEVMLFEPYYGYHKNAALASGCGVTLATLEPPSWSIERETLEAAASDETAAIVVNTPANPSGAVFGRSDLETIADFCRDRDLLAFTDEIYEYFLYDDAEHVSLATLPGMWERTVTISGFSKTFAITGWRLGYALGSRSLIKPIGLVNDVKYVCAPTPLQHGVARGMRNLADDYYNRLAGRFEERRDFLCDALERAGLDPYRPSGSYYILADVSSLGFDDARRAAMYILEEGGVASVPGSAFYDDPIGEDLVRFCYAVEWEQLREAADRLARAFG